MRRPARKPARRSPIPAVAGSRALGGPPCRATRPDGSLGTSASDHLSLNDIRRPRAGRNRKPKQALQPGRPAPRTAPLYPRAALQETIPTSTTAASPPTVASDAPSTPRPALAHGDTEGGPVDSLMANPPRSGSSPATGRSGGRIAVLGDVGQ